jgi:RNA recognition motif-containing protein
VETKIARVQRRSKGFGFVDFAEKAGAEKAVATLNKREIDERAITVEHAKPQVPREEKDASKAPKAASNGAGGEEGGKRTRKPSNRRNRAPAAAATRGEGGEDVKEKPKRLPNSVFVANIPFSMKNEALAELFQSIGLEVLSASVASQRGFSRGYGFVQLANAEQQEKALARNGFSVDGRDLVVQKSRVEEESA